jgi:hypothetical protein
VIGRDREIDAAKQLVLLEEVRLVNEYGAGGTSENADDAQGEIRGNIRLWTGIRLRSLLMARALLTQPSSQTIYHESQYSSHTCCL